MRKYLVFVAVGLLLALVCASYANGAPTQQVKWSQLPDMDRGLDYSSEVKLPSVVAADFQCLDGLPITDIHFWGSYWQTGVPTPPDGSPNSDGFANAPAGGIQAFLLKFWSDVPAGTDQPFSHPGQLLWQTEGVQYNETFFGATNAGKEVWQYSVFLDPAQWFHQEQGRIYWLSIEAIMPDPMRQWGWHESKDHWNDDATQIFKGSPWYELINNTYSVDMAFELTTVPEPGSLAGLALGAFGTIGWVIRSRKRS